MRLDHYELITENDPMCFEFVSEGQKGRIVKGIEFSLIETQTGEVYNLGFGDKLENGEIDDLIITDNGDTQKVLATIVKATLIFLKSRHLAWVYVEGSTPVRTRFYRINISNNLEDAEKLFVISGYINEDWEKFEKNRNYEAFLIKLK